MSEYTAEDFAKATFAKHENGRKAMRIGGDRGVFRWWVGTYGGATDEHMAAEGWTPVVEAHPPTLDDLAEAWEAAEVPTDDAPMRQGDVYIATVDRNDRGLGYLVAAAGRIGTHMHFNARILSRAPRPWQALADVLAEAFGSKQTSQISMAQFLHDRGVRMEHDAAAAALREAADDVHTIDGRKDDALHGWLRARADQIEQEAGR